MELSTKNDKIPDSIEQCNKQSLNDGNENKFSESKQLPYTVMDSESQIPQNNTRLSIRRDSELSNLNKAFSMENISELPVTNTFMRRNSSLPDLLNNTLDDKAQTLQTYARNSSTSSKSI
ncbi:hypothetical protein KUTeg_013179 [Tegillarca granosa]|uniref:Uncharacterized protein n=1 Tax=Tegillarca granosa TaxID=220873 RepID=A0ABQ9EWZ9_TEGGR|nr:hypothetical protein KUTeg_013179 [Tegillarca granosa]